MHNKLQTITINSSGTYYAANFSFAFTFCLDLFQNRLDMAKKLGADFTMEVKRDSKPEEIAREVQSLLGCMPDRTLECTGAESAIQTGIYVSCC